jgi:integrase
MGGSVHFDKNANRFFVQVFWEKKRIRIWRYNSEPIWAEKTAQKLLDKIRAEIDSKEFNPKAYFPKYPLSVSEYSEQWLKVIEVSPNTHKDYRYSVRKFIIPFFQDKDIRKIRHNDLCEFYKWIPRQAKGKYNVMSCLRTMLRHAWRNEDISKVPPFPTLSYDPPQVIEYLTMDQQNKVLEAVPERHRPIFMIMMEYGLRPGEARALKWDCVTDTEIFIKRSFSENLLRETTKTGKIRRYGLTPYIKEVFKNKVRSIDGFMFVRDDARPYTSKDLNKIWHTACHKVGIKIKLYNAVRHSLGCQLLDEGQELELVRDILGHTRSDMTRRYARRSSDVITSVLSDRRKIIPMVGKRSVKKK